MDRRAVIFDLDGTLLDTLDDLADSANHVLGEFGFPTHPVDAYRYFIGDGIGTLIRRILPENRRDEGTMNEVLLAYRGEYGRRWNVKTRPYEGIEALLDGLSARGVRLAILSNKPDEFARKCVDAMLPRWTFDLVQGERPDGPRKPDPAGALEIAARWGLPPSQVAYAGDTGTDMKTAAAAGMFAVGVLWGFRGEEELVAGGARVLIRRPCELLDLVGVDNPSSE